MNPLIPPINETQTLGATINDMLRHQCQPAIPLMLGQIDAATLRQQMEQLANTLPYPGAHWIRKPRPIPLGALARTNPGFIRRVK